MSLAVLKSHASILNPNTDATPMADWLVQRQRGIGGSEAAAAVGLSPWQTPYALWCQKTGETPLIQKDTEPMKWGRRLERAIGEGFAEDTGIAVTRYPVMLQSSEWPWMIVNLDFLTVTADGVVECKNVGLHMASEWEDGNVPDHYQLQGQHELAVTGLDTVWFAVLVGGQNPRYIEVRRDDAVIEQLVDQEKAFWELVQSLEAPSVDGAASTTEALRRRFADPIEGSAVEVVPEDVIPLLNRRDALKSEKKAVDTELTYVENQLKAMLGDFEIGTIAGKPFYTWKKQERGGYYVEATSYRTLRRCNTKGGT